MRYIHNGSGIESHLPSESLCLFLCSLPVTRIYCSWLRLWRCGDQAGDRVGQTQQHRVVVGDEDIAHAVGARAGGEQRKAAPEERMGGIGDLDFRRVVHRWVIDRGIKIFDRSTKSIKPR